MANKAPEFFFTNYFRVSCLCFLVHPGGPFFAKKDLARGQIQKASLLTAKIHWLLLDGNSTKRLAFSLTASSQSCRQLN